MEAIIELLSQYSIEGIIFLCILVLAAVDFILRIKDSFLGRVKGQFSKENSEEELKKEILLTLQDLKNQNLNLEKKIEAINSRLDGVEVELKLAEERLQESTRSYLIDAHHKFVYHEKAIDILSLQSIERRYVYYKAAGGNSFIDSLMKEIRELPKTETQYNRWGGE